MNWAIPAAIQAFLNLVGLVAVGLAVVGKIKSGKYQEQKEVLALLRERAEVLEAKIGILQTSLDDTNKRLKDHMELAAITEESLRAEISQYQKLNKNLQVQIDRLEA